MTSLPATRMLPASAWYAPARIFIRVDLPAPFSPTMAWISPVRTDRDTSSSAWTPGKRLLIPDISRTNRASSGFVPASTPVPIVSLKWPSPLALYAYVLGY